MFESDDEGNFESISQLKTLKQKPEKKKKKKLITRDLKMYDMKNYKSLQKNNLINKKDKNESMTLD